MTISARAMRPGAKRTPQTLRARARAVNGSGVFGAFPEQPYHPAVRSGKKAPAKRKPQQKKVRAPFPKTRLLGPWEVGAPQIQALGESIDELLWQLLRAEGVAPSQLRTGPDRRVSDGGIDGEVTGFTGASHQVPRGDSQWLISSKALAKTTELKKWLEGCLAGSSVTGVSRVAVVTNTALTGKKAVVRKLEQDFQIRILDAVQIAAWTNAFPGLVSNIQRGGRGGVSLSEELEKLRAIPFIEDQSREQFRSDLVGSLASDHPEPFRLEGFPGIGKTRLALEVLAGIPKLAPRTLYFSDLDGERRTAFDDLTRWVRADAERHAFIVVDECNAEMDGYCRTCVRDNPRLGLLTIGKASESQIRTDVRTIQPLGTEQMIAFLKAKKIEDNEIAVYLAKQCQGFIKAADVLADAVRKDATLTGARLALLAKEHDLFAKAFDATDLRQLELVALFTELGWSGSRATEIECVARYFEIALNDFFRSRKRWAERGILQATDGCVYLSPHVLANDLALRVMDVHEDRIPALFSVLPPSPSFAG